MQLAPGDVFAGYRVVRQIGSGGMGAVYLVEHPRLPRRDALKLLNRELSAEPDFVARFMREADIVSALSHRNIVSIYDRGEEAGQLWLTMRYVDGIDAEAALEQAGGLLPASRAVHIVNEVAAALDAAHRRHLVHRDVKPANVLLCAADDDEPEQVFLTDFGIAKSLDAAARLTRTGLVVATFDYASPEQIEAQPLDARSDVYSLGCLLYKLLTGSVPFPGETLLAPAAGHLGLPPPRPTALVPWLAPALDDVIARAMAKHPADRFPSCRALALAAAAAMDDYPEAPRPPYRVFLSRAGTGPGGGVLLGPMRTDGMSEEDSARLVALVRRTRFFDLPEQLAGSAAPPGRRRVTIEIGCTGRVHRVVADLDTPRRPPEFEDLVATIERMPRTLPSAPRAAPPTQRNVPPPRRDLAAAASAPPFAPPAENRFAQPPPPVPPPVVPIATGRPAHTSAPPGEAVARRSGPLPQVQDWRSGPPTPPPGRTPVIPPPEPPPGPPWRHKAPEPAAPRRGRSAVLALLTAVVVGAGVTTWLLLGGDGAGGGEEAGASASTEPVATDPPTAGGIRALEALPKSTPLGPGTLVAAHEVGPEDSDLYLVDVAAGTGPTVTGGTEGDVLPVLSPQRDTIVYLRRYADGRVELRAVAPDGNGDRELFPGGLPDCTVPGRPAWNPREASQLVLACYDDGDQVTLRFLSLDGVTIRNLDVPPDVADIDDLAFSPDGTLLAYWGHADPGNAGNLYVQAIDGSAPRRLTRAGTDNGPAWSPDGESIVFSRGVGDGARGLFALALDDDAEPEPLLDPGANSDRSPSWSPTGDRIVFRSDRDGEAPGDQLWIMTAEGGDVRQLTTGGEAASAPAWGHR